MTTKETNPKDAVGCKKPPASTVSQAVMREVGVGMLEGALKYGRHNYRVSGVRASVYYDATRRHIDSWWEGEDMDPDTDGLLHHVTKAICSLCVLRDAMIQDKFIDDRPPKTRATMDEMQRVVDHLLEKYPEPVEPFTEENTVETIPVPWSR